MPSEFAEERKNSMRGRRRDSSCRLIVTKVRREAEDEGLGREDEGPQEGEGPEEDCEEVRPARDTATPRIIRQR